MTARPYSSSFVLRRSALAAAFAAAFAAPVSLPLAVPTTALALAAALLPETASAVYVVSTLAGGGSDGGIASGSANGSGVAATFNSPTSVAVDTAGNVYVADRSSHLIRKITPDGEVTTLAGTAGTSGHADGSGTAATFYQPHGVAVDGSGNIYVGDRMNNLIRKINTTGTVTTLAGLATTTGHADGSGTAATFNQPQGVAADGSGNLYVADYLNSLIRKIVISTGEVTTLAGDINTSGHADGAGTAATFYRPTGVTVDDSGNLYVADANNHLIRKIVISTGEVSTLAGGGSDGITAGHADGSGTAATFNFPFGIAYFDGNLYVADYNNHLIRKIVISTGEVTTVAGGGSVGSTTSGHANGINTAATFNSPYGVGVDSSGNIYVADRSNNLIRKITPIPTPTLSSSVPADNASGVAPGATIALTFSETMAVGSGNLKVVNDADSTTETIDVTAPGSKFAWSNSNQTLTITPGTALAAGKAYHLEIDATAFVNTATTPVAYNGIANATDFNFTMVSGPKFTGLTPAANAYVKSGFTVGYTLDKNAASASIVFTRSGGSADPDSHTCTLQGTALETGAARSVDLSQNANGCTSALPLVDGATYAIALSATDSVPLTGTAAIAGISYDASAPAKHATSPIAAAKGSSNSGAGYEAGDIITFKFTEPVATNNITLANLGFVDGNLPGTGAAVAATDASDGYATTFTLTLGSGTNLAAGMSITIDPSKSVDRAGNPAADYVSFSVPAFATVPAAATAVTATAGNASVSVAFTAPASNGGAEISEYLVSCEAATSNDRFNSFAGVYPFSASGSSSPITVTGLTNGTAYHCLVNAKNSVGYGNSSNWSNTFTPAAPSSGGSSESPSSNPFNPAGSETASEVKANADSGSSFTPATSSLVTNLGNLEGKVGVSDNGVVVITTTTTEPVKLKNDAPDNVLFSLPASKSVDLQVGGKTLGITTNTDPVKDDAGKTVTTVLETKTLTNEQGNTTQVVRVVKGQAVVSATADNQIVGGLTLSKDSTLRNVVATANTSSSSAGFFKNPNDNSGSVSAEKGSVTVDVTRAGVQPSSDQAHGFAASSTDKTTLTLQAGEVARFNKSGELIGVYVGSLSGSAGKTGDALALNAPSGVIAYPKTVARLDGNILGRLGSNLTAYFANAIGVTAASALSQDAATGVASLNTGSKDYYGLPLLPITVDTSIPDGGVRLADGTVVWSQSGISVRFAPAVSDIAALASDASAYGLSTQVQEDGSLKLTGTGKMYFARSRFETEPTGSAGFGWNSATTRIAYTSGKGKTQVLDPALYDATQIGKAVAALGSGWTLNSDAAGVLTVSGPAGERFVLLPDYEVDLATTVSDGKTVGTAWQATDGKLYYLYSTGFIPVTQGFAVQ